MPQDIQPVTVASDGSMPSTSGGGRVPFGGFGPSASPDVPIRVVAPLDVNAAPTAAMKLAQALGVTQKILQPVLIKKAQIAGVDQEAKGEAAGATGSVDPLLASDAAYRMGATRATAARSAITAIAQLHQKINDPSDPMSKAPLFDSAPGKNDGLMNQADAYLQSQLGGLERDPVAAKEITPLVVATMNEIAGRKLAQQAQATQQTAVGAAVAKATSDATEGTKVFNYQSEFDNIKSVIPGPGSALAARQALDNGMVAQAIATHNPRILDMIQPAPGAPAVGPQTLLRITEARQRIAVDQAQDNKVASNKAQLGIMRGILAGHDPRQLLQQYAGTPGADPGFIPRAMSFTHSLGEESAADTVDGSTGARLTADIASGKITDTAGLLQAVQATGATGKAASGLLAKGLGDLHSVQSLDQNDMSYKAGIQFLSEHYKAHPALGVPPNPVATQQQAGAMLAYRKQYAANLKQNQSPEEASTKALQSVQEQWGDPFEQQVTHTGPAKDDADRLNAITSARTNPQAFLGSGVTPTDIARMRDMGYVSQEQAAAAATLWLQHNSPTHR